MKEAIGGGWLLGFVSIFIVLMAGYLTVSINYTKAFKVKNRIISLIEENEGFTTSTQDLTNINIDTLKNGTNLKTEEKVFIYLDQIGYKYTGVNCPDGFNTDPYTGGYCVKKIKTNQGAYYKVASFISLELPLVWLKINVPITGETKVIYNVNDSL